MFARNHSVVIGMIHLAPLPGAPGFEGDLARVEEQAVYDASALAEGGCDALMVENFFDTPFFAEEVGPHTVAAMAVIARRLIRETDLPLGINVLRNDLRSALAVSAACGGRFCRVNVHIGARLTDQGLVQGRAAETLRYRAAIQGSDIDIWADLAVKHSQALVAVDPVQEVEELVHRGRADVVIVTGTTTGRPPTPASVAAVKEICSVPVVVGSGMTTEGVSAFRDVADGFIVGTALKKGGVLDEPVDVARVREFVGRLR